MHTGWYGLSDCVSQPRTSFVPKTSTLRAFVMLCDACFHAFSCVLVHFDAFLENLLAQTKPRQCCIFVSHYITRFDIYRIYQVPNIELTYRTVSNVNALHPLLIVIVPVVLCTSMLMLDGKKTTDRTTKWSYRFYFSFVGIVYTYPPQLSFDISTFRCNLRKVLIVIVEGCECPKCEERQQSPPPQKQLQTRNRTLTVTISRKKLNISRQRKSPGFVRYHQTHGASSN